MSCKVTTLSLTVSGASLASAFAILRVKLSLRRLPTMTTTLCGMAMGFLYERAGLPRTQPSCSRKRCKRINCVVFSAFGSDRLVRAEISFALVRIDQIFFAGRTLGVDHDVVWLQRLLQ